MDEWIRDGATLFYTQVPCSRRTLISLCFRSKSIPSSGNLRGFGGLRKGWNYYYEPRGTYHSISTGRDLHVEIRWSGFYVCGVMSFFSSTEQHVDGDIPLWLGNGSHSFTIGSIQYIEVLLEGDTRPPLQPSTKIGPRGPKETRHCLSVATFA